MKQICKIVLGIVLAVMIIRACQMEYVCDVVDSIPYDIKERILNDHPECADIDVLADFWVNKGDSIVAEIVAEQEYEKELREYLQQHPEEWDNN
jgi:CO dehydrogenase/acetyl-CoA synthase beta subunit|nr:MAG TPA: BLM protein [Caudoviricetes sp.]